MISRVVLFAFVGFGVAARAPEDGYSREQLQPLTQFRRVGACRSGALAAKQALIMLGSSIVGPLLSA